MTRPDHTPLPHADAEPKRSAGEASGPPSPVIGIDLGTTNSLVAHCTEAGPRILTSPQGRRSLPSVVRLAAASGAQRAAGAAPYALDAIGDAARAGAAEHPTRTFHSVKRLMGRSVVDVRDDLPHLPYGVVEGPHQTARVVLPPPPPPEGNEREAHLSRERPASDADAATGEAASPLTLTLTPQEVSALILRELKGWADAALGMDVTRAVVTVPAYFDDAQRQATRDAGRLAGLEVLRIVNEPTAAALAYGLGLKDTPTPSPLKSPQKPTLSEPGPTPTTISLNTKLNPAACTSDLSTDPRPLPGAGAVPGGAQTIAVYDLGGGTFDISILRLQPTPTGTIDQVLATDGNTHLGGDDLDHLLAQHLLQQLPPKPTVTDRGPAHQQTLRRLAEQTKIALSDREAIDVDLTPLLPPGSPSAAAHEKSQVTRATFEAIIAPLIDQTLDACRRCLRNARLTAEQVDRVVLVGGSTRIPLVRQKVSEFFGKPAYTALDPDEVVALGASVQGAILAGLHGDTLLLDVIPLSLGIETMGGAVAKLIVANTTLPARASERFSTYVDGQTSVKIHVLQGERELVQDCRSLATFHLTGIPPMPAGIPKLLVTFLVDANGILSVEALEERSGRRAQVQVVPNHGLTREEVAQIERDSFAYARQDMRTHRLIDLRLHARLDLRHIQHQLERLTPPAAPQKPAVIDRGPTLDPAYRTQLEEHIATVQRMIDTPDDQLDPDAFQKALHDLDHASLRLAEINIALTLREQ